MSSSEKPNVLATLAAWRERGEDNLDPVRFQFIEAMARRAAGHGGDVRRLLDDKILGLLETYGARIKHAESSSGDSISNSPEVTPAAARPLAELIAYIGNPAPPGSHAPASGDAVPRQPSYPELPVIDYFRETWAKVSANRQVRQSQEHVPENAGPLNSNNLVHRSLSVMRDLSPGYLQHFLFYVDALSWMEQLNSVGTPPAKDAARAGSARKSTRVKPR